MEDSIRIVYKAAEVMLTNEEYMDMMTDIYHLIGNAIVESNQKERGE